MLMFQRLPGGIFVVGRQTFRRMAHQRKSWLRQMPYATTCFHGRAVKAFRFVYNLNARNNSWQFMNLRHSPILKKKKKMQLNSLIMSLYLANKYLSDNLRTVPATSIIKCILSWIYNSRYLYLEALLWKLSVINMSS